MQHFEEAIKKAPINLGAFNSHVKLKIDTTD